MAKNSYYRKIKTLFWQDSKVSEEMNINERYFFLYILTNPHTNLSGLYEITKKQMADETGFSKDELNELINKLVSLKLIKYDSKCNEILIINWSRYNWSTSDKLLKGVGNELLYVKSSELFNNLKEYLTNTDFSLEVNDINTISISYNYKNSRNKNENIEEEGEGEKRIRAMTKKKNDLPFYSELKLNNQQLSNVAKITGVELNDVVNSYDEIKANSFQLSTGEFIDSEEDFINYINSKFKTGREYSSKNLPFY